MPKFETLREALLGDDGDRYHYACRVCDARFTAAQPTVETVNCPNCGAHDVRDAPSDDD